MDMVQVTDVANRRSDTSYVFSGAMLEIWRRSEE